MPVQPSVVAVEDVTPEWLTQVLLQSGELSGARVTNVQRATCGTGQLGDSYRFTLEYDPAGAGPKTLVGKFPSKDATSREFGGRSGFYRCEIGFYTRLARGMPASVPSAVYAAIEDNGIDFVLLMQDLAPARAVDQLVGCSADEAASVLAEVAALHASSWHDASLAAQDWLRGPVAIFTHVTDSYAEVIRTFPEISGGLVADADVAEAARLIAYAQAWKRAFSEPQCLWHSDMRADNVLFDVEGGRRGVALLDWQGLGFGRGTIDVAYFLGTSMTPEQRRAHERALVSHYHTELAGRGIDGYSAAQCWDDYRLLSIHGLQIGVFGLGAVKRTPRGDQMWKTWIERTAIQVRDLDSFSLLKRL